MTGLPDVLGYHVARESWWWPILGPNRNADDDILVGRYAPDGGCRWEFTIAATNLGLQLRIYDEAWAAFEETSGLFAALSAIAGDHDTTGVDDARQLRPRRSVPPLTLDHVRHVLDGAGFTDLTRREKPPSVR